MQSFVIAGVGNAHLQTQDGYHILKSKTLTESGINITVSSADIRGGLSNPLISRYFYDSLMELTLTDAIFNMQYVAMNLGTAITIGGDATTTEVITTTVANSITVAGTPIEWNGVGKIGLYRIQGAEDDWKRIEFTGKTATATGLPIGSKICVQYTVANNSLNQLIIPSAIVPDEVFLTLTVPLFKASSKNPKKESQVGELRYIVPRYQLSASMDFSMSSTGASTTPLSGTALASYEIEGCGEAGKYGYLQQIIYDEKWEDDLEALAVDGGDADITLSIGGIKTTNLSIIGIHTNNRVSHVNPSYLTFTADSGGRVTVSNTGVITAVSAGEGYITIKATNKPSVECMVKVTVTS